jgi:hypothetical protein
VLLTHFLSGFEMVPFAIIITGTTFVFAFHIPCIYIARSFYFNIFSAFFFISFLSPGIAVSINRHVPFFGHGL